MKSFLIVLRSFVLRSFIVASLLVLSGTTRASAAPLPLQGFWQMVDGQAKPLNPNDWSQGYLLIAVGFTHCPDICPTTLLRYRQLLHLLDDSPEAKALGLPKQLRFVFVTIDPVRDVLSKLNEYVQFFDTRIIGLRSDNFQQLNQLVETLGADYGYQRGGKPLSQAEIKQLTATDDYEVSHSVSLYLYTADGELLDVFAYHEEKNALLLAILAAIKQHQQQQQSPTDSGGN